MLLPKKHKALAAAVVSALAEYNLSKEAVEHIVRKFLPIVQKELDKIQPKSSEESPFKVRAGYSENYLTLEVPASYTMTALYRDIEKWAKVMKVKHWGISSTKILEEGRRLYRVTKATQQQPRLTALEREMQAYLNELLPRDV